MYRKRIQATCISVILMCLTACCVTQQSWSATQKNDGKPSSSSEKKEAATKIPSTNEDFLLKQLFSFKNQPNAPKTIQAQIQKSMSSAKETENAVFKARLKQSQPDPKEWEVLSKRVDDSIQDLSHYKAFLWTKDPWENSLPDEMPVTAESLKEIHLKACVNEQEPASFMISNLGANPLDARIVLHDLKSVKDERIFLPIRNMEIHEVLYYPMRDGKTYADPLPLSDQIHRIQVPVGESREVWLNVDTTNIVPGEYQGILEVCPLDRFTPSQKIQIQITVMPVYLPKEMPIAVYNWDYAGNDRYMKDLARHRVNHFLISTQICLPECDAQGNVIKIDYTQHDKEVKLKRETGGKIIYSFGVVAAFDNNVAKSKGWVFMSDPWEKAFTTWLSDWISHIKSLGLDYSDFSMQIWDEAWGENSAKVVKVGPLLRQIDPKVKWIMDGDQGAPEASTMDPYVDIWIPRIAGMTNFDWSPETLKYFQNLHKNGKTVWCYTCDTDMISRPVNAYYRLKPWWVWEHGFDGVCYWAYNSWRGDAYNDFDSGGDSYSDNAAVYPADDSPVTSRRWEASREGLDDYLYLYLLKNTISQAEKIGISADSQKSLLEKLPKEVLSHDQDPKVVENAKDQILDSLVGLQADLQKDATSQLNWKRDPDQILLILDNPNNLNGELLYRSSSDQNWKKLKLLSKDSKLLGKIVNPENSQDYEVYGMLWNTLGKTVVIPVSTIPAK